MHKINYAQVNAKLYEGQTSEYLQRKIIQFPFDFCTYIP